MLHSRRGGLARKERALNSVIAVAFGIVWDEPVFVRTGLFDDRPIVGPREAFRFLQDELSIQSGRAHWAAVSACDAALRNDAHLGRSRETFVAAYAAYKLRCD